VLSLGERRGSLDVAYALSKERRRTAQRPVSLRNKEIRMWLRWIVRGTIRNQNDPGSAADARGRRKGRQVGTNVSFSRNVDSVLLLAGSENFSFLERSLALRS
jgi:hypothetical protein